MMPAKRRRLQTRLPALFYLLLLGLPPIPYFLYKPLVCSHGSTLRISVKINPSHHILKFGNIHVLVLPPLFFFIASLNFIRFVCPFSNMCVTLTPCHAACTRNTKKRGFAGDIDSRDVLQTGPRPHRDGPQPLLYTRLFLLVAFACMLTVEVFFCSTIQQKYL